MSTNPYKSWGIYTITLLILGITERFTFPENRPLDDLVDATIIAVGCVGAIVCWFLSYRTLTDSSTDLSKSRAQIAITWVFGPVAGVTAAISPAVDIDGGLLLFYPPVLGLFLTTFVLPVLFFLHYRKSSMNNSVPTEPEK
ncbi:MAG TPA: hypothetical protein EYM99_05330 [Alphaproteobacteria bacterium]|nr:hypothetical protein [Planctomycetaceae bacterium]HIN92227.1 hypothetical protein [Alphaproteobacteria bacterium]